MKSQDEMKILATSGLLLVDSLVFHELLSRTDPEIRTIASIRMDSNVKRSLEDEWKKILKKNYAPIFEVALRIITELPASPQVNRGLKELIEVAYDIASSHVLLKHDLFGRVYHWLLLGKLTKYYATFYTSIPAARLLARLLINLPSPLKASTIPPFYGENPLKVVDFACGSGTLLSAVYKELELRHRLECEEPNTKALHKYLIEEGLWGFDVLQHATHLALTTLFLHEPEQPVKTSKLYALKLGVFGDERLLGSINLLQNNVLTKRMLLTGAGVGPVQMGIKQKKVKGTVLPKFHICVMNPPFTRSVGGNLLFGGLPKDERRALQQELKNLLRQQGLSGIGQAGLGAVFVFLADKYLEPDGRLGFVLPKAVLSGVAWSKVREKLLNDYHIEYVISSFEGPDNWNFSENTSYSEILLIARKLPKNAEKKHTIFVNLWRKPVNEIEAIAVASQLLHMYDNSQVFDICNCNATSYSLRLRGKKVGEAYSATIKDNQIGCYTTFAQSELNRIALLLRKGIVYTPRQGIIKYIPIIPLSNLIVDIGPDRSQVHAAFKVEEGGTYSALWGYESNRMTQISLSPNVKLNPKIKKVEIARNLWKKSSNFVIIERAWLPTYRIVCSCLTEPVLSNVWWPVVTNNIEINKLLSLWLNSTWGLLLLLSSAEITRGPWVQFKKEHLKMLPVLDVRKLSRNQYESLLEYYDKISRQHFKPFPEEFSKPKARKYLDEKINEVLEIDVDLSDVYDMLAKDPMINGGSLTN